VKKKKKESGRPPVETGDDKVSKEGFLQRRGTFKFIEAAVGGTSAALRSRGVVGLKGARRAARKKVHKKQRRPTINERQKKTALVIGGTSF